jgi:Domain of unknown function (DUF1707)
VTAGREDDTAGTAGGLRASRADREQVIEVLKVAFVQERLAKDEFDLRVGHALASRTYADLHVLTADIPGGVARAQPPAERARQPGKGLAPKTVARVTGVGAGASMAFVAVELLVSSAPAGLGVILVGMTGILVAGLLAALLTFLSWAVQRSGGRAAQGPPPGPDVQASLRPAPERQPPATRRGPRRTAEAARTRSHRGPVHAVSPA